jgi:hypothetical protein
MAPRVVLSPVPNLPFDIMEWRVRIDGEATDYSVCRIGPKGDTFCLHQPGKHRYGSYTTYERLKDIRETVAVDVAEHGILAGLHEAMVRRTYVGKDRVIN